MSQQMRNGYGFDFSVPVGQSMAVSSITGTYSATIVAGPGNGTALATDSTGGGTYGPYAGGVVIRLVAGANSFIDYDIATSPVLNYSGPLGAGYNSVGDVASAVDGGGNIIPLAIVHRNLWAQFSATTLCADDGSVLDLSGNANHATRGANLSIAQMNGAAGYYQTLLAGTNGHDPSLHMPSINFDYDGGEILLLASLFKMPAPAADGALIANSSSASFNGFRIRARTTGYLDVGMFSTTGSVNFASGNCINVLLDNTLHQFAVLINGRTKQAIFWEDGAMTRATVTFPATCDTRESTSLNFGSVLQTPTVIAHTSATQQRGTVIMRWSATDPAPESANVTSLLAKLRRAPGRIVTMSDV